MASKRASSPHGRNGCAIDVASPFFAPIKLAFFVALVAATRSAPNVAVGASPRASLALLKLSRAWAALRGRDYVLPDDIKLFVPAVLNHRLILEPDLWMDRRATGKVIADITNSIPVPVIEDTEGPAR